MLDLTIYKPVWEGRMLMKNLFKLRKQNDTKFKQIAIRRAMIRYYNTINQGKVALPSCVLADFAILRTKAFERVDELYEKLAI